eukprot:Rmarinus@m.18501
MKHTFILILWTFGFCVAQEYESISGYSYREPPSGYAYHIERFVPSPGVRGTFDHAGYGATFNAFPRINRPSYVLEDHHAGSELGFDNRAFVGRAFQDGFNHASNDHWARQYGDVGVLSHRLENLPEVVRFYEPAGGFKGFDEDY